MSLILTRKHILKAIGRIERDYAIGLCAAFRTSRICNFIDATGGRMMPYGVFYWSGNSQGREQRLMFLAFMLTWHDELTGHRE